MNDQPKQLEPKPCPFCNTIPEVTYFGNDDPNWGPNTEWWFVSCLKCDFCITVGEECTKDAAIAAWNNRPGEERQTCCPELCSADVASYCQFCGGRLPKDIKTDLQNALLDDGL